MSHDDSSHTRGTPGKPLLLFGWALVAAGCALLAVALWPDRPWLQTVVAARKALLVVSAGLVLTSTARAWRAMTED